MNAQPQPRPSPKSTRSRRPKRHNYWIALVLVLVVLGLGGWEYSRQERTVEVRTMSPAYQDIEATVSSTGVVTPAHEFQARANFSGIVDRIYVHVGQKVRAGQMLLYLKDQYAMSRLQSARAALDAAELSLSKAEKNGSPDDRIGDSSDVARARMDRETAAAALATLRKLEERGSASQAEVLKGSQQLKLADATLRDTEQRISERYSPAEIQSLKVKVRAEEDAVTAERISWGNANVSTPIAGTVYLVPVSQYDFVPAGTVLMDVSELKHMEVRASFYEDDIAKLRIGEPATIEWDGAPGKTWTGTVISRPMAVERTGSLPTGLCVIALTGRGNGLPINSSVVVHVQWQNRSHVLAIPRTAIRYEGGDRFVYRVVNGRLRATPVKTGIFDAMRIEVTGGLTDGDVVALGSTEGKELRDGMRVTTAHDP